jgi:hypothetical protein
VKILQEHFGDLKRSFISFNRDFIKLSEYFFNFKGAEQHFLTSQKNIIEEDNIEKVKGSGIPNFDVYPKDEKRKKNLKII